MNQFVSQLLLLPPICGLTVSVNWATSTCTHFGSAMISHWSSLLAVESFGYDSHTGDNILRHFKQITKEYGLIGFSAPVYGQRLQHGLRIAGFFLAWLYMSSHTHSFQWCQQGKPASGSIGEEIWDAIAYLCKYVKQATGIKETLPVSIKHGGDTRPWTSIYRRAHSIHIRYTKLSEKLTERVKLPLLAAVDKELNEQIRDVTEVFNCVFENL